MSESDLRAARKAWRQRNSDGRNTFEGERTQAPPGFQVTEHAMPAGFAGLVDPSDGSEPVAERHVHIFDPEDPDA